MTDEDQTKAIDPLEEIAELKAKLKFNKLLMLGVLFISLITFSILFTAAGYFFKQLKELKAAPPTSMQIQLKRVEKQMQGISSYLDSESQSIAAHHLRINLLQEECSAANSPALTALYLSRETDNQKLLSEMLIGTKQLASMTTGSRDWIKPYEKNLNALKNSSAKRASQWANQP